MPQTIGVVTSGSGAVIRDIIHRVRDRFPTHILLWPAPVQGEGAAEKVAAAIEGFNNLRPDGHPRRPDIIIVARGGGSLEDLWPFNEECVIRAVYASEIPLISAVGHETDTMLIDYVSDLRAPTPTGAAEFAVPVKAELSTRLNNLTARLLNGGIRYLKNAVPGWKGWPGAFPIWNRYCLKRLKNWMTGLNASTRLSKTFCQTKTTKLNGQTSVLITSKTFWKKARKFK